MEYFHARIVLNKKGYMIFVKYKLKKWHYDLNNLENAKLGVVFSCDGSKRIF